MTNHKTDIEQNMTRHYYKLGWKWWIALILAALIMAFLRKDLGELAAAFRAGYAAG